MACRNSGRDSKAGIRVMLYGCLRLRAPWNPHACGAKSGLAEAGIAHAAGGGVGGGGGGGVGETAGQAGAQPALEAGTGSLVAGQGAAGGARGLAGRIVL